ncbi:hypothetical protein MNBD_GAMMA13-472 [hydrothermal vent metagenome]|uniref:LbtU family siderophore porin n=1 Tax=hydrothermal vent metagenome TaxID=652676 RepID=A0A3B0YWN2_9ZZZZ
MVLLWLLVFCSAQAESLVPEEKGAVRLYRTPSEQREAGLNHQLTPWLTVGGLAELEWNYDRLGYSNRRSNQGDDDSSASVQLNATATPWSFAKGELILEYDTDTDRLDVDEAIAALEYGAWELAAGRQYLPFGVFFSHFANGPLLEFGETRNTAVALAYDYDEHFDFSLAVYQGQGQKADKNSKQMDWTLALEAWPNDSLSFGFSYLSDLADADSDLLGDDNHRYQRRVAGVSGYLLWINGRYEISAEALGATRSFRELDADSNQPLAWNLEFAHYLHPNVDWALRVEGSDGLEDAPKLRYGAAISFRAGRYGSLTIDYLHSHFKHNFASDDNDNPINQNDQVSAQLSVAF